MVYSKEQQAIFSEVANGTSNVMVQAYAGCGKSTTIVAACSHIPSNKTAGLFAFGRKNADDLKEKAEKAKLYNVTASTFHSVGYWANRANNPKFKPSFKVNHNNKVREITETYITEDTERMLSPIVECVSMAKKVGIGVPEICDIDDTDKWADMIAHFGIGDNVIDDVDAFIDTCICVLKDNNRIMNKVDFDDQIYFPLLYNWRLKDTYDYVFVDECLDTNPTRRLLASKLLKPGGKLVFVGDKYQAIMGFTGADNDAMDIIEEEYKCVVLPLSTTYRCPTSVVEQANRFVEGIKAGPNNPAGEVNKVAFNNLTSTVTAGDVILSRYNLHLVTLFFHFTKKGIKAKIEGKDQIASLSFLASRFKKTSLMSIMDDLEEYVYDTTLSMREKGKHEAAERLEDRAACLSSVIEYCLSKSMYHISELKETLNEMFGDNVNRADVVSLCSCHKSKGMEWDNVYILGLDELMPSSMATLDWEMQQELNLQYVAVTRAKKVLNLVEGVPKKVKTSDFQN